MRLRKKILSIGVLFAAVLIVVSCGGSKLKVAPISKSENPSDLIQKLEKDITNARRDQVNVLAPTWFSKAESSLKTAKEGLAQGDKLAVILGDIANGRAQLLTARDKSQVSRSVLASAIKSRDLARAAGATTLGQDYVRAEENFLDLTREVEKDNVKYAKKRQGQVAEEYRKLELRAIKVKTLGKVREMLNQARTQKTYKIAPRTYHEAKKTLQEADEFITKNPYKKEEMLKKANLALFKARRHLEVARQGDKVEDMKPEPIVLLIENKLHDIAVKLAAPDMRDHSFDTQVENILGTITALQYERSAVIDKSKDQQVLLDQLQKRIAALEGKTLEEQTAKERLLAEKRFNQLFEKVRTYFEPGEAEVYKTEGQLVLRLKAMGFPVGQSVILPKNYSLLSKVQRAIRTFNDVDVIIEGHTDSTGSEELNEHLSEKRADAVRQYLVANQTLPYDKIIAVGYGSSRPLASNKTEKGRAINRRIDLILTPHFQRGAAQ